MDIPVLPPRPYQIPMWTVLKDNPPEVMIMMHRRIGKTVGILSWLSAKALEEVNSYLYVMKQRTQVKSGVWAGKMEDGRSVLDTIFPPSIRRKTDATSMTIDFINGSKITFTGSDSIDSLVGSHFKVIILDEMALYDKPAEVYGYLDPIVKSCGGTFILVSTPRYGSWFNQRVSNAKELGIPLLVLDIYTSGRFTPEQIEKMKTKAIDENQLPFFESEFELRLDTPLMEAYYAGFNEPSNDNTLDGEYYAAWDLGQTDKTVITIFQYNGSEILIIDMIEGKGKTALEYLPLIDYKIKTHFLPHDAKHVRGYTSSDSVVTSLRKQGTTNIKVLPKTVSLMNDINLVRTKMASIHWLINKPVNKLLRAVRGYSPDTSGKPKHCDYSDSFRYAVIGSTLISEVQEYVPTVHGGNTAWMG